MYKVHVFTVSCSVAKTDRSERTDYGLFPGLKKTIESSPFFVRRPGPLLPRRPGWMNNRLIFFLNGLQNLEQRANRFIELHGQCVE